MADVDDMANWADAPLGDEEDDDADGDAFETFDKDGIKTTISYYKNSKGKDVKVEKKIKVHKKSIRINKNALKRREYMMEHPFNLNGEVGAAEQSVVAFEFANKPLDDENYHFADLDRVKPINMRAMKSTIREVENEADRAPEEPLGGRRYVPKGGRGPGSDECFGIRVSNLSEEVTEADLYELFGGKQNMGAINKVHLVKNKETAESKGFAFVHYHRKEDAATAIRLLHRHGYDNRILTVEWAKPPSKDKAPN